MLAPDRRAFALGIAGMAAASGWLAGVATGRAQDIWTHPLRPPSETGAARDPAAEQFVQRAVQQLTAVAADPSLDAKRKSEEIDQILDQRSDPASMADFVLGKYARTITPEQRARFATAFAAYRRRVTRYWVGHYGGETLAVTGSSQLKPGEVLVYGEVSGGRFRQPVEMAWWVVGQDDARKVLDIQFNGAWVGVLQQNEMVATLDRDGGNVDALIAQIDKLPRT